MFLVFQGRGSRILIIMDYYVNYCQKTNVYKKWTNFVNGISSYVHDNSHLFTLKVFFQKFGRSNSDILLYKILKHTQRVWKWNFFLSKILE